jgi:predicted SAM-dependent methyltransferase
MNKYLNPLRWAIGAGFRANRYRDKLVRERRRRAAKAWLDYKSVRPFKVNIGCGHAPFAGWINVDLDPASNADILWDVTDGLPFDNDSCTFIHTEHFLEHLAIQQGVRFLAECYRCLGRGGVVRIGMPSLQETVRSYYENDWINGSWLEKYGFTWIKTRAEYINICFREWGHQWLYDAEELHRRLREAGFDQITDTVLGESPHSELRNRETRIETLLICEATK